MSAVRKALRRQALQATAADLPPARVSGFLAIAEQRNTNAARSLSLPLTPLSTPTFVAAAAERGAVIDLGGPDEMLRRTAANEPRFRPRFAP